MSRMADRMLTGTMDVPHWVRADVTREQIAQQRDTMAEVLTSVPVIVIDNVCEYLYAGTSQEEWKIERDFPTLAPPFPRFWMEMRRPSKIVSEVHGERRVTDSEMGYAWGFMVQAFNPHERVDDAVQAMVNHAHDGHLAMSMDSTLRALGPAIQRKLAESGGDVDAFRRLLGPHEVEVLQGMKFYQAFARSGYDPAMAEAAIRAALTANRDIRWTISFDHWMEVPKGYIFGPIANHMHQLNEAGEPIGTGVFSMYQTASTPVEWLYSISTQLHSAIFPALLALGFFHCKNVAVQTQEPPVKLSRAHYRHHGRPLLRYYTLDIKPMQQVLRQVGRSDEVGLPKALHICRGHFKDYRRSGLFGKHQGLYWFDMHVRGTAERGVVVKDYAVQPPAGGSR